MKAPIELVNNGHTIQFNFSKGSTLKWNGEKYDLLQFHFHTRSEHTISEKHFPMELHLVHKSETGGLAVIGVFFKEGKENSLLEQFINNLPSEANQVFSDEAEINAADLISPNAGYFTYSGSLTTPPCSQIVNWIVLKENLEASQRQIKKIQEIMGENFRPTQAVNGREIKEFI